MPRPKQCPTYHVTLHKSKDFNCYKKKDAGFCSLSDYLRADEPAEVQDMKSLNSIPEL